MALFGRETEQDRARAESWARWAQRQNVLAIVSLVLGIFSLIEFGALVIPGIGGIATGAIALRQLRLANYEPIDAAADSSAPTMARTSPVGSIEYLRGQLPEPIDASKYERLDAPVPRTRGRGLAWGGIITSVISLLFAIWIYTANYGGIAR